MLDIHWDTSQAIYSHGTNGCAASMSCIRWAMTALGYLLSNMPFKQVSTLPSQRKRILPATANSSANWAFVMTGIAKSEQVTHHTIAGPNGFLDNFLNRGMTRNRSPHSQLRH